MSPTLSAALVIAVVVSLLKPFIEAWVPKTSSLHDGAIRLVAVALGVVGTIIQCAATITTALTPYAVWNAAGQGLLAAVTAIATFHLVTANYFQPLDSVVVSSPAAPSSTATPAASTIEQVAADGFKLPEAK